MLRDIQRQSTRGRILKSLALASLREDLFFFLFSEKTRALCPWALRLSHGRWQGAGGGEGMAPLDFHTLSLKPSKFQKFFHF